MKSLEELLYENLVESCSTKECENPGVGIFKKENEEEEAERIKAIRCNCENEEEEAEKASIKDEKGFRNYAENKFKIVFGDNLDNEKMNKTIDGILKDNNKLVEDGNWGELIGMLNKSFGA